MRGYARKPTVWQRPLQAGPLAKIFGRASVASQIVIDQKIGVFQHNRSIPVVCSAETKASFATNGMAAGAARAAGHSAEASTIIFCRSFFVPMTEMRSALRQFRIPSPSKRFFRDLGMLAYGALSTRK
jgi:hypothetical protein